MSKCQGAAVWLHDKRENDARWIYRYHCRRCRRALRCSPMVVTLGGTALLISVCSCGRTAVKTVSPNIKTFLRFRCSLARVAACYPADNGLDTCNNGYLDLTWEPGTVMLYHRRRLRSSLSRKSLLFICNAHIIIVCFESHLSLNHRLR